MDLPLDRQGLNSDVLHYEAHLFLRPEGWKKVLKIVVKRYSDFGKKLLPL